MMSQDVPLPVILSEAKNPVITSLLFSVILSEAKNPVRPCPLS